MNYSLKSSLSGTNRTRGFAVRLTMLIVATSVAIASMPITESIVNAQLPRDLQDRFEHLLDGPSP